MPVYINKARAHDQAVKVRRFSEQRAEWYDSLRHAFLSYCDRVPADVWKKSGFVSLDQFRAEGLAVLEGNLDFWREKAELGEDDPFAEMRAVMDISLDPDMTLEQLQEALAAGRMQEQPQRFTSYRRR